MGLLKDLIDRHHQDSRDQAFRQFDAYKSVLGDPNARPEAKEYAMNQMISLTGNNKKQAQGLVPIFKSLLGVGAGGGGSAAGGGASAGMGAMGAMAGMDTVGGGAGGGGSASSGTGTAGGSMSSVPQMTSLLSPPSPAPSPMAAPAPSQAAPQATPQAQPADPALTGGSKEWLIAHGYTQDKDGAWNKQNETTRTDQYGIVPSEPTESVATDNQPSPANTASPTNAASPASPASPANVDSTRPRPMARPVARPQLTAQAQPQQAQPMQQARPPLQQVQAEPSSFGPMRYFMTPEEREAIQRRNSTFLADLEVDKARKMGGVNSEIAAKARAEQFARYQELIKGEYSIPEALTISGYKPPSGAFAADQRDHAPSKVKLTVPGKQNGEDGQITVFEDGSTKFIKTGVAPPVKAGPRPAPPQYEVRDGKNVRVDVLPDGTERVTPASKQFPPRAITNINPQTETDIKDVVEGIASGDLPPNLTGFYRNKLAIEAGLKRKGYNLVEAERDWKSVNKFTQTLNSDRITKLMSATSFAKESLDVIDQLNDQASKTIPGRSDKFPDWNKATMLAAKKGVLGPEAQKVATNLESQIKDLQFELGSVYMGGNSPTDNGIKQAQGILDSNWTHDQLKSAVNLSRRNLTIRINSIKHLAPLGVNANSPYTKGMDHGDEPDTSSFTSPPPASASADNPSANPWRLPKKAGAAIPGDITQKYVDLAGGDKAKARQLAIADGWNIK